MKIFRHKENHQLYTIERLVLDIRFLNGNANAGIYPHPYKHSIVVSNFQNRSNLKCEDYVLNTFELVGLASHM